VEHEGEVLATHRLPEPPMTPKEFMLQYRNLVVPLIDRRSIAYVDVRQHRNGAGQQDKALPTGGHTGANGDGEVRPAIVQELTKKALPLGGNLFLLKIANGAYQAPPRPRPGPPRGVIDPFTSDVEYVDLEEVNRAFENKGSPEDVADMLRLACGLGVVQNFMGWDGGPVTPGMLISFCDRYIGIDSTGFVGNYFRAIGLAEPGPSAPAYAFAPSERRKHRLDDVRARDVLVWLENDQSGDHVAIIDRVNRIDRDEAGAVTAVECTVVESSADGLGQSVCTLTPSGPQRFTVRRGGDQPSGEQVAIASWVSL
jgi:hypothetical protein